MDCKESTRVEDGMSPDPTRTKEAADFRQGRRIPKGRVCQDFKQAGLKVPKREIFVTELIILSDPLWIGDLRTKVKNQICMNC